MIRARSRFLGFAGSVMAAVILLATVPAVLADEPVDYVADFQVVSATIDVVTGRPVVTYSFRCLEHVDYVRIRSILAQRHAGVDDYGWSWETSGVANCQAGTMVTLAVLYGGQQGSYHPGQAEAWQPASTRTSPP